MSTLFRLLALAPALLLPLGAAQVFSTGFSTPADVEKNFVALRPSGEAALHHYAHSAGLGLRKTGVGTLSVLFDTSARDASPGRPGSSGSAADSALAAVELSAGVRFVDFNAAGFGYWARVPADGRSGLLALVNIVAPDRVRLRIFGSGSSPLDAAPGKPLRDATGNPTLPLDPGAIYRVVLRVHDTAEGTRVELALRDTQGPLAATDVLVPPGGCPAAGQVGFRLSSQTLVIDDLTISSL